MVLGEHKLARVRMLKATLVSCRALLVGEVHEISEADARLIVAMKRAEYVVDDAALEPKAEVAHSKRKR